MKMFKKMLAVLLTITTLIGIFSCGTSVFAEEYNEYAENKEYEQSLLTEAVEIEKEQSEIICEVPEKRDEYSKTYKRADGSFTTILSKSPLHKLQEGEWKDIDNSLKSDGDIITNSDGAFDVEFPETINDNEKITITNGNESISFSVNDVESAKSSIQTNETTEDLIQQDLEKTVSQITYENVEENTDMQYIVSSNSVKENIIVSNKESLKTTYSFDIEKGDLEAEFDKERNIVFKNNKNETVFVIPAPVMTDARNGVSYDIDVELKNQDKSVLTLIYTPSKEWLESEERVYPIVIDPVIKFDSNGGDYIEDTGICYSTSNPGVENRPLADSVLNFIMDLEETEDGVLTKIKSEALVKVNMDPFACLKQPNITVTDVNFLAKADVIDGNILVKTINGSWDAETIVYTDVYPEDGTEPLITYSDEIMDYHTGRNSSTEEDTAGLIAFNITEAFNGWLSGEEANNGFAIVAGEGAVALICLDGYIEAIGSHKKTYYDTYIAVDYVDTANANDNYEYLSQEIGRAGSVNVNTFTRGLTLNRSDLSMDGLRMPAEISFIHNSAFSAFLEIYLDVLLDDEEDFEFPELYGNNWCPAYVQWMAELTEGQYQFFTEEGTLVTFNQKEEKKVDEEGNETDETIVAFEEEETSDSGYTLELIDQERSVDYDNFKITSPDGREIYFYDVGLVSEIREAEPNADGSYDKISIFYDEELPFMIDFVTDGIGRKYDFICDSETGYLSEIKCLTADGTPIKAGTTNTDLKVSYGYDSNGNLTSVTYPDGEAVTYTYDSNGNLIKAQNIDGYNIQYTYDSLGKVTNISEYAGTTPGNKIYLTQLSGRQVKVVDDFSGTEIYQFGKDGKLHYTFDEKGNYLKSDYAPANDENVYSSNDWKISSQNLLKNGSFEDNSLIITNLDGAKYWSSEFETTALPAQQVENNNNIGYDSSSFGEKVYLISSTEKSTNFVTQTVEVANTSSYTFSAFVRSEATGLLTLKLTGIDSANNVDKEASVTIDATTGWQRYYVTYKPSDNFEPEEIIVSIGFEDNKGTYYVDCAQLEKGLGTAEYNLIENGTFNNTDEYWSESTVLTDLLNSEPVKAVKLNGGLPQYTTNADEILTLTDNISATTQNIKINGKKGETYSIGGWFKGFFDDNSINSFVSSEYSPIIPSKTNSAAQIKVTYSYLNAEQENVTENFVVDFAPHNDDWQYAVDTFALKGDTESVDVTVMSKNIPEDCFATGIELALDNNSFSFVEDDETEEAETPPSSTGTENTTTANTTTANTTTGNTNTGNTPPTECPCEDCEELDCACRCNSAEVCTCIQCKRRSDIETTSENGKTITTSSFDGEKYMQSAVTYSNDLNNVISETDENNILSGYAYNINGSLTEFTDGLNNKTTYQSNAMGYLTLAESNVSGLSDNAVIMAISYVYDGDLLTKVNQGNVQYTYEYDSWGQLKKVLVDGVTLVCYNYDEKNPEYRSRITSIVFGSSESTCFTVEYIYDKETGDIVTVNKYRMVEGETDSITYNYKYDNLGNLDYIKDNGTGHFIDYTDDGIVIKDGQTGPVIYQTKDIEIPENDTSNLVSITQETANGTSYNNKIYESDYSEGTGKTTEKESVSVVLSQDENNNFTYGKTIGTQTLSDWFGRNEAVTVMTKDPVDTATTDFASISSQYGYVTNENITTNLISTVTNTISGEETNTVNYNYTYDSNGRITNASTVSSVPNLSGASQYIYDEAGQLIKEITGSTIYEYAYDSKGNISSRKVYSGEALVSTDTFAYGANTWEDRLTGYNNKTITYDSVGNPTSYLGANLSWRGRELAGYSKGNKQISYSYDVDGMRYRKVVTENNKTATYDYVYSDGILILLTYTENDIKNTARFVYDSWGEPRGFMLNDSATYLYLKNAQGDITGILDENGEIVVRYTYNAWGAVDFVVPFGVDPSASTILATVSPFTYRGYCYDYDIGMYYLQSRYYDPEICRFINADSTDYLGATGTLLSYNLFAYCENDGVNFVDERGTWGEDVHQGYYDVGGLNRKKYDKVYVSYYVPKITVNFLKYESQYYGTYYWAKTVGFSTSHAKKIADACYAVDTIYSPLSKEYQGWHFNTNSNEVGDSRKIISFFMALEAASYFDSATRVKRGRKTKFVNEGLKYLGYALHPLQDMYAHTPDKCYLLPKTGMWSHIFVLDTDNARERFGQVKAAEHATVKLLQTFMDEYGSLFK